MNRKTEFERFEVRFRPGFKAKIAEAAQSEGVTLGEMIIRAACRGIGFPEEEAVPPRKLPGRRPKVATEPHPVKRARRAQKLTGGKEKAKASE